MNAQLRSTLLLEPRPADADWAVVTRRDGAWRLAWLRQGRLEQPFGPIFAHAAEAATAAVLVRRAHLLEPIEQRAPGLFPPAQASADGLA